MKQLLEETGADGYNGDTMVLKYAVSLQVEVPLMQCPGVLRRLLLLCDQSCLGAGVRRCGERVELHAAGLGLLGEPARTAVRGPVALARK
jgi:hypothetical protein